MAEDHTKWSDAANAFGKRAFDIRESLPLGERGKLDASLSIGASLLAVTVLLDRIADALDASNNIAERGQ